MGKNTLRRIATTAEAIARHQGLVQGRREADEEIERVERINRKLLRALKDMVEWGEISGLAPALLEEPRRAIRVAEGRENDPDGSKR